MRAAEHKTAAGPRRRARLAPARARPPATACDEVLDELTRIREEVGWPPLAAPIGQILGSQALLHVLSAAATRRSSTSSARCSRAATASPPGPIDAPSSARSGCHRGRAGRGGAAGARIDRGRGRRARLERGGAVAARALRRRGRAAAAVDPRPRERRRDARGGRRRPGARRADPRDRAHRPGVRRRRGDDRGGGHAGLRAADARAARRHSWQPPCRAADEPEPEPAPAPAGDGIVRVEAPMVGIFYRAPQPGAPPFVEEGDDRRRRPDALHPRGDEADERDQGGRRRHRPHDPRRQRRAGRVRPAAVRARAGRAAPLDAL